jgi:serine/threonine protein kinase
MLAFDGAIKVIDLGSFGALRLGDQKPSRLFRSPGYTAPEVILKRSLDLRSSVFAVGVAIWEALCGERLVADKPEAYVREVLKGTWEPPPIPRQDVPGTVLKLVQDMLSQRPEDRPTTIDEVHGPLVSALRRVGPTFGSAMLSRLLWQRCEPMIGKLEAITKRIVQGTNTMQESQQVQTQTFGRVATSVKAVVKLKAGDPIPGTRYRLVRALGTGGSADVFAAQHMELDRQVAIKILSPQFANDPSARAQFRMEARACSRVVHPHIVDVIDFGELEDGRFFFAMELLDGRSLANVIRREGRLDPGRVVGIFRQIAKALQAAHDNGIIHRDLKPDNVMLIKRDGRDDIVKLVDFGVMAFSETKGGMRVGTPGFMAPEQIRGAAPHEAMDVYAFGISLYECLAGQLPYPASDLKVFTKAQSEGPPRALRTIAPLVPASLEQFVHRCLERHPDARPPSIADAEAELIRAQRVAGLSTAWDHLPPPASLKDTRAADAGVLPGKAEPPSGAGAPAEREDRVGSKKSRQLAAAALALAGLAGAAILVQRGLSSRDPAPSESIRMVSRLSRAADLPFERSARSEGRPDGGLALAPHADSVKRAQEVDPSAGDVAQDTKRLPGVRMSARAPVGEEEGGASRRAERRKPRTSERDVQPVVDLKRSARLTGTSVANQLESRRFVEQGQRALRDGQLAEAKEHLRAAQRLDPRSVAAAVGLAAVAFEDGRYGAAVEHARHALRMDRRHIRAHLLLGDAHYKLARMADAVKAWRAILEINPAHRLAKSRLARVQ